MAAMKGIAIHNRNSTREIQKTASKKNVQPRLTKRLLIVVVSLSLLFSLLADDWIAGVAICILWALWHYLRPIEGPPVLSIALTFQWIQVTSGIFYYAITGFRLPPMYLSDYRLMVLIGLGCILSLLLGIKLGLRIHQRFSKFDEEKHRPLQAISQRNLPLFYIASIALTGSASAFAWTIPQLTQAILVLTYIRFALLFLIFRRLVKPQLRLTWIVLILLGEVILGATGYFAGFREALIMAALALLEVFDQYKIRHWITIFILAFIVFITGMIWTDIKGAYRQQFSNAEFAESQALRFDYIVSAFEQWFTQDQGGFTENLDAMIDRLWPIYYPALAVSRVPSALPHENGAILWRAVHHVMTPRLFFPEKADLESDSEMVRRYSGEQVAGKEQGTSIAFGYAAESYIDFGIPLMFIPILIYGLLQGVAYSWLLNAVQHRELAISLVVVVFWLSLYLFERAWGFTLGLAGTLFIYLGGATILLDRFLLARNTRYATRWYVSALRNRVDRAH
jgi:hypothetical protein